MQSSRLNQTEICLDQDSIRHSVSKVIRSFRDGPEYNALAVISYGSDHLFLSVTVSNIVINIRKICWRKFMYNCECVNVNNTEWICSTCQT